MNLFFLIYLMIEIFSTYTVYRMLGVLNGKSEKNRVLSFISYAAFCIMGMLIYFLDGRPLVNVISNIIMFFILTFLYNSKLSKKIISVIVAYAILLCAELFIYAIISYAYVASLEQDSYASLLPHISIRLIIYAVMLMLNKFWGMKKGELMPNLYWLGIIVVPVATIYILYLIPIEALNGSQVVVVIAIALIANYGIFRLFDPLLLQVKGEKMQKILLLRENEAYLKQFELMKESSGAIEYVRHRIKNNLITIKMYLEKEEKEEAIQYIAKLRDLESNVKCYFDTGNPAIDSILNVKIHTAEQYEIKIKHKINIPEGVKIDPYDITAILGNVLDCAIRDLKTYNIDEKNLIIGVRYDKGRLFIIVRHTALTMDSDVASMGIKRDKTAFESVNRAVGKYYGRMECTIWKGEFEVYILLFVS